MAEEKMHCGGHHHFLVTLGLIAIVYGVVQWAMVAYSLSSGVSWILGGVLLIVVWWFKKALWMKK